MKRHATAETFTMLFGNRILILGGHALGMCLSSPTAIAVPVSVPAM